LSILTSKVPRKLESMLKPRRYKGLYGGRGGAKSHFFAEQIIIKCIQNTTRVVCIREVQNSIKDSVKQLLTDKITSFDVGHLFTVLDQEIRGINGSIIVFRGMQSYSAANIKSLEGFDIAFVEEAQTLTQHSLDLLRPTLRKPASELWFAWNPTYKTDAVDQFFRQNPPANAISININWQDNPWFKNTPLYDDMLADYANNEDKAAHVWGGEYGSSTGAILAKWVNQADRDGRINDNVSYDKNGAGIVVSCDLGFRDTCGWWYWQPVLGGSHVLKYDADHGLDVDDWVPRISDNLDSIGAASADNIARIWLPSDAKVKTFQSKHSSFEKFRAAFGGNKIRIVPPSRKLNQIEAARTYIKRCAFNKTQCEEGLDGLRAWEFDYNDDSGVFSREPKHNWACFVAGTLVETSGGMISIEKLTTDDCVVTPTGIRRVMAVYEYDTNKLIEITTRDGRKVICTPEHKFFTAAGLIPADELYYGLSLYTGKERSWQLISLILKVVGTIGIHEAISGLTQQESKGEMELSTGNCIEIFMQAFMGLSQKVTRFIIKMKAQAITSLETLSAYQEPLTSLCTGQLTEEGRLLGINPKRDKNFTQKLQQNNGVKIVKESSQDVRRALKKQGQQLKNGMEAKKGKSGTLSTGRKYGKQERLSIKFARFAAKNLLHFGLEQNIAGKIVELKRLDSEQKVYDLTVEFDHCFIANGILTSNSHPADGFAYGCQVLREPVPETIQHPIDKQLIDKSIQSITMGSLTKNHLAKMRRARENNG